MKEMSKSAKADLELVEAIKAKTGRKSEEAFSAIYKKYHDSMLFHFRSLGRDEETAKELVLEAFVKMNNNLDKYNEEVSAFSTWLFKLTQHIFIDNLRKKKDDCLLISDLAITDDENHTVEFEVADADGTPEDKMLTVEKNRRINNIINAMENKELAEVIKMRFFGGMSYEEISQETGKPIGTVKAFLFRAKQILREEFVKADIALPVNNKKKSVKENAELEEA